MKNRLVLTLAAVLGCAMHVPAAYGAEPATTPPKTQDATRVSWDSPRLSHIEAIWRARGVPAGTHPKGVPFLRVKSLAALLKRELSRDELHDLIASCATMPSDDDNRSEFADMLHLRLRDVVREHGRSGCPRDIALRILSEQVLSRHRHRAVHSRSGRRGLPS